MYCYHFIITITIINIIIIIIIIITIIIIIIVIIIIVLKVLVRQQGKSLKIASSLTFSSFFPFLRTLYKIIYLKAAIYTFFRLRSCVLD